MGQEYFGKANVAREKEPGKGEFDGYVQGVAMFSKGGENARGENEAVREDECVIVEVLGENGAREHVV